nr:hypothetical protein [Tanacetum cinerariifolium]
MVTCVCMTVSTMEPNNVKEVMTDPAWIESMQEELLQLKRLDAPPSPAYIPRLEYPEYLPPANDVLPDEEQPLPADVSPTAESLGYITESDPEMEPEEEDGDDEKFEDSIEYSTREEMMMVMICRRMMLMTRRKRSETAATPPPFGYRVAARISVQPHILMPFSSESKVESLLAIPTPPLSPVSPTSYPLPPFLMPLPIFTPLPTSSFPLPLSLPSTSEVGESSVAAARQIRPALTIADRRRANDRLIGRLRRERRYFRTLSTTYAQEMDANTLQRQHIDDEDRLTRHIQHEHAQRDVAPEDGDRYITELDPEMEPEEEDGDDEKFEDSIEYPTSRGDDDADDDGDDLSEDDANDEEEEESSNSETAATPPPFGYRVAARISVQPHILMPFSSESEPLPAAVSPTVELPGYITESEPETEPEEEDGDDKKSEDDFIEYPTSGGDDDADDDGDDLSDDDADDEDEEEPSDSEEEEEEHLALSVERLLAMPTPPPSPVSPTSYPLPPLLMPLPIFTPLPTSLFSLPLSLPSTSGSESIPEADIPLRKRARFTTPTGGYEVGESSVDAAARQIRPALTIADRCRADDRLIDRLRRERRYFRTLSTIYAQEVARSRDYCTQIMDYCQSREVHTSMLVTQMEALQRDVSTLQRQHIKHAQRDVAPEDGYSCS